MTLWVIFKDGEYWGTARDYEAAYRDVDDNIDRFWDTGWERYSIYEYTPSTGDCLKPRPR